MQEKVGCEEIWERICQIQGRDPNIDITQDTSSYADNDGDVNDSSSGGGGTATSIHHDEDQVSCSSTSSTTSGMGHHGSGGGGNQSGNDPLVLRLPLCELSRLNEISELVSSSFATPMLRYIYKFVALLSVHNVSLFVIYRLLWVDRSGIRFPTSKMSYRNIQKNIQIPEEL